jgi:HSP20 family molecular chaperone IbpA
MLSGERRQKEEQKDEKFHRVEATTATSRAPSHFPDDDEDARQSKDGVLTIHVPKAQSEVRKLSTDKVQKRVAIGGIIRGQRP